MQERKRRKGEKEGKRRREVVGKGRVERKEERRKKGRKVSREEVGGYRRVEVGGLVKRESGEVEKGRERVRELLGKREKVGKGKRKGKERERWEEERVRKGTGYRVKESVLGGKGGEVVREREVGYGHTQEYKRGSGVEVEVWKNNRGLKVRSTGVGARERVMKEVCGRERIRPRSRYTGYGRSRKSRVGRKKLKPTKGRGG